ncbi:hypothetical protein MBLNU459_g8315t3 [Dothideomycetes sp. NU459]
MRSFFAIPAFAALAAAIPAASPQDIEFDLVIAAPNPTYSTEIGVSAQIVTYNPTAIASAVVAEISSDSVAETDVAKRVKRTACAPQPSGATGAPTVSPDTPAAFQSNAAFASVASSAPVPSGYSQTFTNLGASNNAYGYMGYTTLSTYDSAGCAAKCNAINGCMAVNIYYERDPSVDPGTGSSGCANPASVTMIKCVFWGGPVNAGNALNTGQTRNQFQVVIAGSNGYVNKTIVSPPGYGTAVDLGTSAINAPYDSFGYNTFMGAQIFTSGPFNASLCGLACNAQTQYNIQHPPTDGSPVQTCQFFNTYILYVNTTANLQGQYCALYSETWSSSYATNSGQYRGSDHYLIEYSYAYSNSTNPGTANYNGAVHQASKDISYSTLQSFCSSYLGYSVPISTVSATSTVTQLTTATSVTTVTVTSGAAAKRAIQAGNHKRALSTPAVLTKYPATVLSAACSLQATQATTTALTTVSTTVTGSTSTVTVASTSTVTAAPPGFTCSQTNTCGSFTPNCGSDCYCVQDANGSGRCVQGEVESNGNNCQADSDCGSGAFCFTNSCRGNVCVNYSYQCLNTNYARRLFRKDTGTVYNELLGTNVTVSS